MTNRVQNEKQFHATQPELPSYAACMVEEYRETTPWSKNPLIFFRDSPCHELLERLQAMCNSELRGVSHHRKKFDVILRDEQGELQNESFYKLQEMHDFVAARLKQDSA